MLDPGETDQDAIKREFREEALDSSQLDEQKKAQNNRLLEDNFVNGEEVRIWAEYLAAAPHFGICIETRYCKQTHIFVVLVDKASAQAKCYD